MINIDKERLLANFLRYVKVDTKVAPDAGKTPTSPGQLELAKIVRQDLKNAGVEELSLTDTGYLVATIRSNIPSTHPAYGNVPTIGLVTHFDTAAEVSGANVKPQIIKNYQGEPLKYPGNPELSLDSTEAPKLNDCIGHTLITSDGTTLLGGDDKAGVAALVEIAHYLKNHPEHLHGTVKLGIMPDEEIGVGAELLDLENFGAQFVYTLDGSGMGEIDVESFNGYKGKITFKGNAAFPGYGKGVYLNASRVMADFVAAMEEGCWPENCEERQGIWWVDDLKGSTSEAELTVFLRDFDVEGIKEKERKLQAVREKILARYPKAAIDISIGETYKNYKCELDRDKRVVDYAFEAVEKVGLTPRKMYVRGGNDSCHFCFKGVLSTNLFIGMEQMHSLKEWISLEVMEKGTETALMLLQVWVDHCR